MFKLNSTLSHDGRGVARKRVTPSTFPSSEKGNAQSEDGKTIFITAALPEEVVKVRSYQRHRHFDEAICEEVVENASPDRVEPRCASFLTCGGCSLQHMRLEAQLQHKQAVLLEQLKHFGKIEQQEMLPPLYNDTASWGYRYRARLSVRYSKGKKDKLLAEPAIAKDAVGNKSYVGFRERANPRFITNMRRCEILLPAIGDHIEALRELIQNLEGREHIPQVEIAAGDEACTLIFRHMQPLSPSDREKLIRFGQQYSFWILLQAHEIHDLEWLFPTEPTSLFYRLSEERLTLFFHPAHFTQVNPYMNQKLVQQALHLLQPQPDEMILDLFCGLGNFSLPLAKRAKQVVGIEGSEVMVEQARYNAEANHLKNTEFYSADLSQQTFKEATWAKRFYDKILLDPPRTGALEIVHSIEQWQPHKILYVSCNPATFSRDAGILVHQKGYNLTQVGIADMFPHTAHVETMGLFEKK